MKVERRGTRPITIGEDFAGLRGKGGERGAFGGLYDRRMVSCHIIPSEKVGDTVLLEEWDSGEKYWINEGFGAAFCLQNPFSSVSL